MGISKYEPVKVYSVARISNGVEDVETLTLLVQTACTYEDVRNPLDLKEFYRIYTDFARLTMNYTPLVYQIAQGKDGYSFNSRGSDLRIVDSVENGRESITFLTYIANSAIRV